MADRSRHGQPEDFVQSVGRALRILEVVSAHPALPIKAVARRCELNLSTTYHLVHTLAHEGYLRRLSDGTYTPGPQLARRFYDLLGALGGRTSSRHVLGHLSASTRYSAYLGRLSADEIVVIDYVEGPGSPYLEDFERGLSVSAHATALGKALLMALPRSNRRALLKEHGMQRFTRNTQTDIAELEGELAGLSRHDVVIEHGEFRDGVACAAMLVTGEPAVEPTWAVVLSAHGDVAAPAKADLRRAASDLAGIERALPD
jgi:DNA-binding IclR family transcriptional regulator